MIRILIAALSILAATGPALAQKVGIGAWENPRMNMIHWIEDAPGVGWYYNWRPDQMYTQSRVRRDVEFVPMIHGAKDVNKRIRSDLRVRHLLAFNEPDGGSGSHQANMSVAEAVRLWPQLERRGLRLSSPATTQGQTLGRNSWQRRFMDQAEAKGLRVDFMAVHYYSTTGNVNEFRNWLHAVYREYRRPIWVTEFAFIDWNRPQAASYAQNARFIQQAMLMMESLPFVERYAWFAANPYPWNGRAPRINLVQNDLTPTPVGMAFDQTLSQISGTRIAAAKSTRAKPARTPKPEPVAQLASPVARLASFDDRRAKPPRDIFVR
ncbi:glycosyl hydrolase [Aestuariivita boseongensis]|uniref:glycosyl hydrolase n=1 Tax=Aestuariivita boseongensis TaxID=1470562 RepID=UPI0009E432BA|nr:glycosyl hydrolase [Aestuariivita boseongensis]